MNETANRIKRLRSRRGFSQEELAERSGLSLRTIQRIENGETEPRGDSLTRLAAALGVTVDDLADWGVAKNRMPIAWMNLSTLSFHFFPLLGIIVPLIVWLPQKNRVKGVDAAARRLLNFQITWIIVLIAGGAFVAYNTTYIIKEAGYVSQSLVAGILKKNVIFVGVMYLLNDIMIGMNVFRANRGKKVVYRPAIPFIRK